MSDTLQRRPQETARRYRRQGDRCASTKPGRRIIFPGKFCMRPVRLLEASGRSTTGSDGKSVFLLSGFICSDFNDFSEPVYLLATPHVATACYMTMTHEIIQNPPNPPFNDVQITAYSWGPNGIAAPNISFDWRCRVPSAEIIL